MRKSPTERERWDKFMTEFGLQPKDPSVVLSTIQSAKYGLDSTTFAVQEFAKSLEFEYQLRDMWTDDAAVNPPRRSYTDPIRDAFDNSRLRTEVNLFDRQTGSGFVGIKLSLPIGN